MNTTAQPGLQTSDPTASKAPGSTEDLLDADGPAAPLRANGELVFTAPWQSRLFATTMHLQQIGHIDWERFRQGLIAQIADHERDLADTEDYDYWGCWQRALERLLAELHSVSATEIDATAETLAARPAGHDHDHSHSHSHDHDHG